MVSCNPLPVQTSPFLATENTGRFAISNACQSSLSTNRRSDGRRYNDPGHAHELTFSCFRQFKMRSKGAFQKIGRGEWLAQDEDDDPFPRQ